MIEKNKNEKLASDLQKSVALLKESASVNLDKDVQIAKLSEKISLSDPKIIDESLFDEFSGVFKKNELRKWRSKSSGQSNDSTFVLNCMRFLYTDLSILNNLSVT